MNKKLRLAVFTAINTSKSLASATHEECLMCACVLYKYCDQVYSSDSSYQSSLLSLANSYCGSISSRVLSLKDKYTSYNKMYNSIVKINKDNFTLYTDENISDVYSAYLDNSIIVPFSTYNFHQSMYKVSGISHYQHTRLLSLHKKIMTPIILYYVDKYSILESAMNIENVIDSDNEVGKEIEFIIDGISNTEILKDIRNGEINISYYNIEIDNNHVKLIP